jgi:hypothetical protein
MRHSTVSASPSGNPHAAGGIQRAPRPSAQYTCLHNDVLRDERLSFRALGVLVEILSRPDNWKTRSESLAANRREGRDAVRAALKELETAGYLVRRKVRDERGRISTVSVIYDVPQVDAQASPTGADLVKPQVTPETDSPAPVIPDAGKPGLLRTHEKNNLLVGSGVEWPNKVGRPHENRSHLQLIEHAPDADRRSFVDWRAQDFDLFVSIVGEGLHSDGSVWQPQGEYDAATWYEAFRTSAKPIQWPGRYLQHLQETDGLDNWVLTKGLEPVEFRNVA